MKDLNIAPGSCISLLVLMATWISCEGPQGLSCWYDTWATLSCTWNHKNFTNAPCWLDAQVDEDSIKGSCNLTTSGGKPRSCNLVLGDDGTHPVVTVASWVTLEVRCLWNHSIVAEKQTYIPYQNLQLNPPESLRLLNLSNGHLNLTWNSHCYHYVTDVRRFEVQYRPEGVAWETLYIHQNQQWVEIPALLPDMFYEFQVRVNQTKYLGRWSIWSEALHWRTPPRGQKSSAGSQLLIPPSSLTPSCPCTEGISKHGFHLRSPCPPTLLLRPPLISLQWRLHPRRNHQRPSLWTSPALWPSQTTVAPATPCAASTIRATSSSGTPAPTRWTPARCTSPTNPWTTTMMIVEAMRTDPTSPSHPPKTHCWVSRTLTPHWGLICAARVSRMYPSRGRACMLLHLPPPSSSSRRHRGLMLSDGRRQIPASHLALSQI